MDQYIEKLDSLKEFMALKIDGRLPVVMGFNMDVSCIPSMPIEKIIDIFNQTGMIFYREHAINTQSITFEEWYESKIKS